MTGNMGRQRPRKFRGGLVLLNFATLLAFGCAARDAATQQAARQLTAEELGLLEVSVGEVASIGRIVRVRGHIRNAYPEEVRGVVYRVRFYHSKIAESRILQTEKIPRPQLRIKPGERRIVNFNVESMYINLKVGTNFGVDAIPMNLGDQPIAPPDDW